LRATTSSKQRLVRNPQKQVKWCEVRRTRWSTDSMVSVYGFPCQWECRVVSASYIKSLGTTHRHD
jgi:hypothetical protein